MGRHVDTATGPALEVGEVEARRHVVSIGRALEALPPQFAGSAIGRDLVGLRKELAEVIERSRRGEGSGPGTEVGRSGWDWATASEAAERIGVTARAVTKACCLGQIPGAHFVTGHGWFIPNEALPDPEDDDGDRSEAAA